MNFDRLKKLQLSQPTKEDLQLKSERRRHFFSLTHRYGLTGAIMAASGGLLLNENAAAQTAQQESELEKAAKHVITLGTAYRLEQQIGFPFAASETKFNLQNITKGKVYVRIAAGGVLGGNTELAKKVQANTIQLGQHSISNLAPFAKEVDVINIPYWCANNQQFTNLVTSKIWKDLVEKPAAANGYKVFCYLTIDPRTCSVSKKFDKPVRTPEDLKGIKFRVPGSKILAQLYSLLGANPTPIAWGETAPAIKSGVADALDPSIAGLWIFGFGDILSWITRSSPVNDGNILTMSKAWFDSLDKITQQEVEYASEITTRQQLANVPSAREYAIASMAKAGVKFYVPTKAEQEAWVKAAGHQRKEWDSFKKELTGSLQNFAKLEKAANTFSGFYVNDVKLG